MDPLTDVSASATFPLPGAQVSRLHGMVLVVLSILLAFLKAVTLKLQFIPGAERRAWGFYPVHVSKYLFFLYRVLS
jgi:hypothetical protein